MVPSDHHHHGHGHDDGRSHGHGLASAHPAQATPWSILRMPVASRLLAALAVSAFLWAIVWLAAR
jgi:hypothetical protein